MIGSVVPAALRAAFALTLLLSPFAAQAQQFGPAELAFRADDGTLMTNHRISPEHAAAIERLPGIFTAGNRKGDVTIVQFYDLNCPFCREAAADIDALIRADRGLRLIFVPYPTLSIQSVEGGKVEIALREIAPQRFMEFRTRVYAGRGVIDGHRALAVTDTMKLDRQRIIEIANAPRTTEILKAHAALGSALKLVATPAYVIHGIAIVGHPGRVPLAKAIGAVRTCKTVVC